MKTTKRLFTCNCGKTYYGRRLPNKWVMIDGKARCSDCATPLSVDRKIEKENQKTLRRLERKEIKQTLKVLVEEANRHAVSDGASKTALDRLKEIGSQPRVIRYVTMATAPNDSDLDTKGD